MKINLRTKLELPDEDDARIMYRALAVEISGILGQRTREKLQLEGNCLVYSCQATDVVAAIASVNSFYTGAAMIEKLIGIAGQMVKKNR